MTEKASRAPAAVSLLVLAVFSLSALAQNAEPELLPLVPLVPEAKPAPEKAAKPKEVKKAPKKTEAKTTEGTAAPAPAAKTKTAPAPAAKPAPVPAQAVKPTPSPAPAAAVPSMTAPAPVPMTAPAPAPAVKPAPPPSPAATVAPAPAPAPVPAASGLTGAPKPLPEQLPPPAPPPEKAVEAVTGTKPAAPAGALTVEKKPEEKKKYKYVELAPVVGIMVPLQSSLAGVFFTAGARILYMLPVLGPGPVKGQPLAIGIDASWYSAKFNYQKRRNGQVLRNIDYSYWVVPIQLEVVYTIPTKTIWRPFVGLGGGTYITGAKASEPAYNTVVKATTTTFGGTGIIGLKAFVGIGDIILELRGNYAMANMPSVVNHLNVGGFTATLGYMFYL